MYFSTFIDQRWTYNLSQSNKNGLQDFFLGVLTYKLSSFLVDINAGGTSTLSTSRSPDELPWDKSDITEGRMEKHNETRPLMKLDQLSFT